MALQWTMNSDTGSLSMSTWVHIVVQFVWYRSFKQITLSIVPVISSFSTKGRNRETNSWLYGGAIVSNTSVTKYLNRVQGDCKTKGM